MTWSRVDSQDAQVADDGALTITKSTVLGTHQAGDILVAVGVAYTRGGNGAGNNIYWGTNDFPGVWATNLSGAMGNDPTGDKDTVGWFIEAFRMTGAEASTGSWSFPADVSGGVPVAGSGYRYVCVGLFRSTEDTEILADALGPSGIDPGFGTNLDADTLVTLGPSASAYASPGNNDGVLYVGLGLTFLRYDYDGSTSPIPGHDVALVGDGYINQLAGTENIPSAATPVARVTVPWISVDGPDYPTFTLEGAEGEYGYEVGSFFGMAGIAWENNPAPTPSTYNQPKRVRSRHAYVKDLPYQITSGMFDREL